MNQVTLTSPLNQQDLRTRHLTCLIAGIAYGLSFPPINLFGFALLAPAFLAFTIRNVLRQQTFSLNLAFWLPAWGVPFHWVISHEIPMASLSSGVALIALICIAAVLSTGSASIAKSPLGRSIGALVGFFWVDVLVQYGPVPMPWVMTGFSQAGSLWMSGLASVVGVLGVGVLVLGVNALVLTLIDRQKNVAWAGALCVGLLFSGSPKSLELAVKPPPPSTIPFIDVLLVQPGYQPSEWSRLDNPERNSELLALMTENQNLSADLIVFPETAFRIERGFSLDPFAFETPILGGAIENVSEGHLNTVILADSTGVRSVYEKRILVPFAERTPFSRVIPFFRTFSVPSGGVKRYLQGQPRELVPFKDVLIQPLICFESLFPRLIDPESDVLVILTQDGWWNSNWARIQHFSYSRMVAIEVGKPMVQVSVDGVSGATNQRGQLLAVSRSNEAAFIPVRIDSLDHPRTGSRLGTFWTVGFMAIVTLLIFVLPIRFRT